MLPIAASKNGGCFLEKKNRYIQVATDLFISESGIHVIYYLKIKFTPLYSIRNNFFKWKINYDVVTPLFIFLSLPPPPLAIVGIWK